MEIFLTKLDCIKICREICYKKRNLTVFPLWKCELLDTSLEHPALRVLLSNFLSLLVFDGVPLLSSLFTLLCESFRDFLIFAYSKSVSRADSKSVDNDRGITFFTFSGVDFGVHDVVVIIGVVFSKASSFDLELNSNANPLLPYDGVLPALLDAQDGLLSSPPLSRASVPFCTDARRWCPGEWGCTGKGLLLLVPGGVWETSPRWMLESPPESRMYFSMAVSVHFGSCWLLFSVSSGRTPWNNKEIDLDKLKPFWHNEYIQ